MSRAHGRPLKIFKVLFYILIIFQKSLVVLAKIMPIANVNRIVFVNNPSTNFALPANLLRFGKYSFIIHRYKFGRFLLGWDITDWNRMTDSAVVFRKPITKGEHPLE